MAAKVISTAALKTELLLQINQRLYEQGTISKAVYETAKIKIVNT